MPKFDWDSDRAHGAGLPASLDLRRIAARYGDTNVQKTAKVAAARSPREAPAVQDAAEEHSGLRYASVAAVLADGFHRLGSGLFVRTSDFRHRTAEVQPHAIWAARRTEDGGIVLVRLREERAVDMRDDTKKRLTE